MNWEAMGAIGEVGGSIAVVATLVLLYRQIKLSSEVTRAQIDTMMKDQMAQHTMQPAIVPDLARIIEIASNDSGELTEDERRRVFWWFSYYGSILEGMFIRWQQNQLSDELWRGYEQIMLGVLSTQHGQQWWQSQMTPYSKSFRLHFEEKMADPSADKSWRLPTSDSSGEING